MKRTMTMFVLTVFAAAAFAFTHSTAAFAQGGSDQQLGVASPYDASPMTRSVTIDNFSFSPATITVPVGTTITFTNRDDIPHTVVSTEQVFKSSPLDTDQKFSFTFDKSGTYEYFCSIHPKMTGKVVVEAK